MNKQSWFMFESLFPHISYQLLAFANIVPTHLIDRKGQLMYERDGSAKMGFLNLPPTVQFQALQLIFAYSLGKPPSFDGGGFDGAGGEDRFGYGAPQPRVGNLVFVHVEGFSKPEHKNDDGDNACEKNCKAGGWFHYRGSHGGWPQCPSSREGCSQRTR
jgi:hypothetical protein